MKADRPVKLTPEELAEFFGDLTRRTRRKLLTQLTPDEQEELFRLLFEQWPDDEVFDEPVN